VYARAAARAELEQRRAAAELERWIPIQGAPLGHRAYDGLRSIYELWDRIRAGAQVTALVAAPPRSRKTTTCFYGATREMMLRPGWKYGYATYNMKAARDRSRECHRLAHATGLRVGAARDVKNRAFDEQSLNLWAAANGSSAKFMSLQGGAVIGSGVDLLHIDDPFNIEEHDSVATLEARWRSIATMLTRLEPGASLIISHHRWTVDDPIGRFLDQLDRGFEELPEDAREMAEQREWVVVELPAYSGADSKGEPVVDLEEWPRIDMRAATPLLDDWFSVRELAAARSTPEVGEEMFGAMYMQAPARGGVVFPAAWQVWEPAPGHELVVRGEVVPTPSLAGKTLTLGADTAGSESSSADYTAVVLLASWWIWYEELELHLMHADVVHFWYERLESTAVVDYVAGIARAVPSAQLGYESQGEGRAQLGFLRRDYPDLLVEELKTTTSKRVRAMPFANAAKAGRVRVPARAPWLPEWRRQTGRFTGRHGPVKDDGPDAGAHAWNLASRTPPPFKGGVGLPSRIRRRPGAF